MPPIVNHPGAWSVSLSVGLSPSEPCRKFWSDRDTICIKDSGVPRKDLLHTADCFGWILYCVHSTQYSLLVLDISHNISETLQDTDIVAMEDY